ncbi:MAG: plasmid mobilization protein [Solirubrobacteraceae bacterium]
MAVDTATIRVTRDTRDRLAQQAQKQGISLAALLAKMAREREIEAIFESERQATRLDAQNPAALEEMRLWESTLEDGIDFDDGLSVD